MPIAAIREASNNFGLSFFLQYFLDSFRTSDLLLLLPTTIFAKYYKHINSSVNSKFAIWFLPVVLFSSISYDYLWHNIDIKARHLPSSFDKIYSIKDLKARITFKISIVYTRYGVLFANSFYLYCIRDIELSKEDLDGISKFINERNKKNLIYTQTNSGKNCVLIIVESLLSSVFIEENTDKVIPKLNKLKNAENTYFNPNVNSNISIGESGDGQFIYMTGLLPLLDDYAVSNIEGKNVYGLASLFKNKGYNTMITIPTSDDVWNQKNISSLYGFDILNANPYNSDNQYMTCDSLLFSFSVSNEKKIKEPFFHTILTSEMHSPYQEIKYKDLVEDMDTSEGYKSYLSKCHTMDIALNNYIESLKTKGIYDNTVIIILADHHAHSLFLGVEKDRIYGERTPLLIINSKNKKEDYYDGEIDQIDIYPTIANLFDLFDNKAKYTGLGLSLFNKERTGSSVNDESWSISNMIIRGDYFK